MYSFNQTFAEALIDGFICSISYSGTVVIVVVLQDLDVELNFVGWCGELHSMLLICKIWKVNPILLINAVR